MPEQIEHEYKSFIISRGSAMPVALMADVGAADGKHVCIARLYCWQGDRQERLGEATRLAWLLVDAIKADQIRPHRIAESVVTQQRDRLAGAVWGLLEALASEFGSGDTVCWPGVLMDAGDDACQVLDGVRGALRRIRQQFCDLGVGQAFCVSSAAFGTVGYEKIALQVMDEGRLANARLIRAEAVGVLDDFAFYEGDEFVEVERFLELEVDDDEGK